MRSALVRECDGSITMSGFKGAERRGFGRRESQIHGTALVPGRGAMACVVRNFSAGGALVTFNEPVVPPLHFRLVIAERKIDVPCEVRHNGRYGTGVSFLETVDIEAFVTPVRRGRLPLPQPPAPTPPIPLDVAAIRRRLVAADAARRRSLIGLLLSS